MRRLREIRAAVMSDWKGCLAVALVMAGVAAVFLNRPEIAASCLLWAWVIQPKREALRANQAIVTAPIEPSAEIREGVRQMAQLRAALMNEGLTSEQAAHQLAEIIAAQNRSDS